MENFAQGWCVLYTRPHHEKKVAEQLLKLNVDTFLPTIKTLKSWCDRKKYVDVPLFPSYIFVRINNIQSYYNSLTIEGVLRYVKVGNQIARVCETVINDIRLIVNNGKDIEVSSERLPRGTRLLIKDGPFTGLCCELIQYKGNQKMLVRIDHLKQSILLNLPFENLAPVSPLYSFA
jgi:transcriptional antiterminator RfaH